MKLLDICYANETPGPLNFIVEPRAEDFALDRGSTIRVVVEYDQAGPLEFSHDADSVAVWLWQGCRCHVWIDGCLVARSSLRISCP